MHKKIDSLQNPLVKEVVQLIHKSGQRKKTGLFTIEGKQEVRLAISAGYELETILYCPDIFDEEISEFEETATLVEVNRNVYDKVAYRGSTQGILAIAKQKDHQLSALNLPNNQPLILVAESPEKPGNMGALLRTADAANLDAVIFANVTTDLYNPNSIRSSVGGIFSNNIAIGSTKDVIDFLRKNSVKIFSSSLDAATDYTMCDFTQAAAIVVGTESTGLSEEWLQNSDQNILIPMQGIIDSMNVSVAAGILIFEARRQRNFKS